MDKELNKALKNLKINLNNGKNSVQITLFDLANLKQGKKFAKNEWKSAFEDQWKPAIENMMWRVAKIVPSGEAFCDCDTYGDHNDLMFLINHDSNFVCYVYEKYVSSYEEPSPISRRVANKIIDYVSNHLSIVRNYVSNEKESFKVVTKMADKKEN